MLRISLLLSIVLHVVLLGAVSVFMPHFDRRDVPVEKAFRVTLRTAVAAQTIPSQNISDKRRMTPPENIRAPLPPSHQTFDPPPPLSPVPPQKLRAIPPAAFQAHVVMPSRMEKKTSSVTPQIRRETPRLREFVAIAQTFPTPIPAASRAVEPTPPLLRQAQDDTQERLSQGGNLAVSPQQNLSMEVSAISDSARALVPAASEFSSVLPADAEMETEAFNQYVQDVTARLNAVKRYPQRARQKGWEGTVVVKLVILATGETEQIKLLEPSRYDMLNRAALQAIEDARPFPPFREGMTLQTIIVKAPIHFTLR